MVQVILHGGDLKYNFDVHLLSTITYLKELLQSVLFIPMNNLIDYMW